MRKMGMDGCWGLTTVPCQRWWLSEWVTPGNTAIPGMTSLEDGDLQHSSALAQSPKGDIEPNHPSEINPNSDSRSRSDGRSRRFVQYRVDQSLGRRPRSLLSLYAKDGCSSDKHNCKIATVKRVCNLFHKLAKRIVLLNDNNIIHIIIMCASIIFRQIGVEYLSLNIFHFDEWAEQPRPMRSE